MLSLSVWVQTWSLSLWHRIGRHSRRAAAERGQTTAEYALMLLGAATVALLLIAWASQTNKVGRLLDTVVDTVLDRVS